MTSSLLPLPHNAILLREVTNMDDKLLFFIMRAESEIRVVSSIVMMSLSTKSPILSSLEVEYMDNFKS